MIKEYPHFYPTNCPPTDAFEAEVEVYRYISQCPPKEEDFKSYYEENPEKYRGVINAYGLSVISDFKSAQNALDTNPALRKKFNFIACGLITKDSGVIKHTPSVRQKKHLTWWVCRNIRICEKFHVQAI